METGIKSTGSAGGEKQTLATATGNPSTRSVPPLSRAFLLYCVPDSGFEPAAAEKAKNSRPKAGYSTTRSRKRPTTKVCLHRSQEPCLNICKYTIYKCYWTIERYFCAKEGACEAMMIQTA